MRCLFTAFAEDVVLIPANSFSDVVERVRGPPESAAHALTAFWQNMNTGGFWHVLVASLKRFNRWMFKEGEALLLSEIKLSLLIMVASRDLREVERTSFGTLLEPALDKLQRNKLCAHYRPRAHVGRLVAPASIEILRNDLWDGSASAITFTEGRSIARDERSISLPSTDSVERTSRLYQPPRHIVRACEERSFDQKMTAALIGRRAEQGEVSEMIVPTRIHARAVAMAAETEGVEGTRETLQGMSRGYFVRVSTHVIRS